MTVISYLTRPFLGSQLRIDRYANSNEIAQQQLVIAPDFNTVYVFPIAAGATLGDVYGKHAWRRKP